MMKKILIWTMAFCLMFGIMSLFVMADETPNEDMVVIFEENFDDYEAGVDIKKTAFADFFYTEAQQIGDSWIKIQENSQGQLYLTSAVFTQAYTNEPIKGAYVFSVDVSESQGDAGRTHFFVRGPQNQSAFYEGDGDADESAGLAGLMIYPKAEKFGVNIKTCDESGKTKNNTQWFTLPQGAVSRVNGEAFYNVRVEDNGTDEIKFFVNDTLMCRVTMANPTKTYSSLGIAKDVCFERATIYDAEGNELATYTDTTVMANGSRIGWATRVAILRFDNFKIMGHADNIETTAPTEAPTETPTEAPTEAVTEAVTVVEPIQTEVGVITDAEAPTEALSQPSETETPRDTTPVVTDKQVIDDSLAVWMLIAVMLVAIGVTAGIVTVKVRK